jgi:2',3'-cyclic-nucleotide 2'-phosphodiesterase / 3'-nucleotidase
MHRIRAIIAAFLLVVPCGARQASVRLLATTDLHGNIYPVDYYTGRAERRGLAKIASLIHAARQENPNSILIDCGDTIQGTPLEYVYQRYVSTGRLPLNLTFSGPVLRHDPMMLVMNQLGYAAMVLGNHEFNFGLRNLQRAREDARFPWISANTAVVPGAPVKPFAPYVVKTLDGVKVAVVGLTTAAIPAWETAEHYRGYRFLAAKQAAQAAIEELHRKEKPDIVIAAVHAGLGPPPGTRAASGGEVVGENMAANIASSVSGIDAIVFGHTHQQVDGLEIGKVLLVQPKNWGMSLAQIDFDLDNREGHWRVVSKRSRIIPVREQTSADPEVLRIAEPYHELAEKYLNKPVAEADAALNGSFGRIEDSPLVDAIQAVQLHYAKADVSFTPLFNPGVKVPKGRVTVRQIAALYIYENYLYAIEGDGRMVKDALENAARYFTRCPDQTCSHGPLIGRDVLGFNYDMAEGVRYDVDLTQPEGQRIRNLTFQGRPLEPDRKLRIAINNYRAGGSGGYVMFRNAKILWRSTEDIRDLMIAYYTQHKRLPAGADGNWRIVPPQALRILRNELLQDASRRGGNR